MNNYFFLKMFNLDNMFDDEAIKNNNKMDEIFSTINPSKAMVDAFNNARKELMEKKLKNFLKEMIIGDDSNNKKKLWIFEKVISKLEPRFIDKIYEKYETEDGLRESIRETFKNICENENHKYYINGGKAALEQSIRLNLNVDEKTVFNGLHDTAKKIFARIKDQYDKMMLPNKIDKAFEENKTAIIYTRFHNILTLPIISSYFDFKNEINIEKAIEQDNVEAIKKFDDENPYTIYSSRVFNLCSYNFAKNCFSFFYSLITENEMILENNFYKYAASNLALDIPLNYANLPLYKTAQKCQVTTKGPNESLILSMNKSIICESVFYSAFNGGIDKKNMDGAKEMIKFLIKYRIVASDVSKYNFSIVGGPVSAYASIIVTYLNNCLR